MREWITLLRFVRDNITLIVFLSVAGVFIAGWVILEAFRSTHNRDEVFRLRQRLSELERERVTGYAGPSPDPVVLSPRWLRRAGAATSADGGCLVVLEGTSPLQNRAVFTVRVDGEAVVRSQGMRVGERLEAEGKSGVYLLSLYGVEGVSAHLSIALRNKHLEASANAVD
jgi:hypothetical protein